MSITDKIRNKVYGWDPQHQSSGWDRLDDKSEGIFDEDATDSAPTDGPKASRVVTGGFNDIGTVTALLAAGLAAVVWDGGYSTLTPTRLLFQLDAGGAR